MKNVLIIGAGGVAHVAAHKAAQHNDILGNICIASRTESKCKKIIQSIKRKKSIKDPSKKIYSKKIDANNVNALVKLIKTTKSEIVLNLGSAFVNMPVLEACIKSKVTYMDTAIHEDPKKVCEDPPWYGNYEWKRKDRCKKAGINAILGIGFDPGVVNAYVARAVKHDFDEIDTIDILDVNAGSHGKYFATNFDPEINLREFSKVWTWENRKWTEYPCHKVKWVYNFPVVGEQPIYLTGHDELHSLSKNVKANSIRFWMGFGDHYINVFTVLKNVGLLSEKPVKMGDGRDVIPLKLLKAVLPDPLSLAPNYNGKTCIGVLVKGKKNGEYKETFTYNICDHALCFKEMESQAISYTAGVPPVAAAILVAQGVWNPKTMVNVEELDPDPLLKLLDQIGLPTKVEVLSTGSKTKKETVAVPA